MKSRPAPRKRRVVASPRVSAEWARRVGVEYQSAALTQHLVLWLIQAGVSPDLVRMGNRIVDDELIHAELAAAVAASAGAELDPIDRETLALTMAPNEPLELAILRVCLSNFCLAETAAVRIFRPLQKHATVALARTALDRVLRDEVRHRDFGWVLLEWLLAQADGDELRGALAVMLPGLVADVHATYVPHGATERSDWETIPDADRAWGLQPLAAYRDALALAWRRDVVPRFADLGIDATVDCPGW